MRSGYPLVCGVVPLALIDLAMMAMNAIDYMDERALPARDRIAALPRRDPNADQRFAGNVGDIITKTLTDLE